MNPTRLRSSFRCLCVLLWLVPISYAGELPTAAPEDVGLSSQKLDRISQAVQTLVDEHKSAGAITMVARHGKVVYFEVAGLRDIGTAKPMDRDTICRIYSMTKPITSVAAMLLIEQDKIDLDDPVAKHLPEFQGVGVFVRSTEGGIETQPPKREPTVRDLLRHTSGLTYGIFGSTPVDQMYQKARVLDPASTLSDMTKKLGQIPLLYQPGTKWNYSVSADVLGRLVEVVSGQPLDAFFEERLFRPLDMRDTGFFVPAAKLDRFASTHGPKEEGGLRVTDAATTSGFRSKPGLLSGGGGLVSTARDYMRFCQMLSRGGELDGKRLLRPETVQTMITNQLPDEAMPVAFGPIQRSGLGFGLGFSVRVQKSALELASEVGEYGWGGAASTHFWISPKHDLAVVVLQQYMPFTPLLEQTIKPLVYQAIEQ